MLTPEDTELFPLHMRQVAAAQNECKDLKSYMEKKSLQEYSKRAINDFEVILENGKVFIPKPLRKNILS